MAQNLLVIILREIKQLNFGSQAFQVKITGSKFIIFERLCLKEYLKLLCIFYRKIILSQTDGIDETGTLVWQLVLALFITYFVVYLMLIKGVAVSLT